MGSLNSDAYQRSTSLNCNAKDEFNYRVEKLVGNQGDVSVQTYSLRKHVFW